MPSLSTFTNFIQSQGPAYLSGPQYIRHAGQRTRYAWAKLTRGKPDGAYMKTSFGADFREKVFLAESTTFQTYTPYDPLTVSNPQLVQTAIAPEVYGYDAITWSDQEAIKNGQNASLTQEARSMMYLDFMTQLYTRAQVSLATGMENKFLAVPVPGTMEGAAQTEPCSLFHLINEFPSSLYVSNSVSMTTKHQITPSGNGIGFRNHIFGYNSPSVSPGSGDTNLLNALDKAANRLTYDAPDGAFSKAPQNWESPGWPSKIALWSYTGIEKLMDLARQRNDMWTRTDELGVLNPVYRGMEMLSIPGLETAAIYPTDGYTTNAAPTTEGGASALNRGPRGYILDTSSVHVMFNKDKMFQYVEPVRPPNQMVTIQYIDVYYQFMVTAPWTCGVITPGNVVGTFPSYSFSSNAQPYSQY